MTGETSYIENGEVHELRYGENHSCYANHAIVGAKGHDRSYFQRPADAMVSDFEWLKENDFAVELVAPGVLRVQAAA